ncbi:LysR family transcriptional regulator [Streptomyces mirabilis]|uniref:LysR family transcriptional regulator n=1 Tax=Streptomyces mirabilis TaxID=68239 RepID=UPI00369E81E9
MSRPLPRLCGPAACANNHQWRTPTVQKRRYGGTAHPHSPDESPAPRPAGSPRSIDPRRLRADDLRYRLAVSRTGRLVTAADALGVDHTTVSRRVAALEKSIGLRLIERGPDGWTLTEIGRAISDSARVIEEAIDRVVDTVEGQDSPSCTARCASARPTASAPPSPRPPSYGCAATTPSSRSNSSPRHGSSPCARPVPISP